MDSPAFGFALTTIRTMQCLRQAARRAPAAAARAPLKKPKTQGGALMDFAREVAGEVSESGVASFDVPCRTARCEPG